MIKTVFKKLTTVGVGKWTVFSRRASIGITYPKQPSSALKLAFHWSKTWRAASAEQAETRHSESIVTPSLAFLTPCFYGARKYRASAFHAVSSRMHDAVGE